MKRRALIFWYSSSNKYSFNTLLGAVEDLIEEPFFRVFFFNKREDLLKGLKEIEERQDEIWFFFSLLTPQYWEIKELITEIKKYLFKKPFYLCAGGPHTTGLPQSLYPLGFNYLFLGEGEFIFRKFLKALQREDYTPQLKGLSFIEGSAIQNLGKAEPIDLEKFPPFSLKLAKVGPIEITRGCPFLCSYCQTPRLFGTRVRHRSIESILFFAEKLLQRGIRDLRFISPNAFSYGSPDGKTLNMQALETLLSELFKLCKNFKGRIFFGTFPSEVRPEHITEETLRLIKTYCANDSLVVGAQTGSEKILNYLKRGHTVEDIKRAVKLILQAGLKAKVDFIFGLPGEKKEDRQETIKLMEELVKKGAIIHAHTFLPLPQTPFRKKPSGQISEEIFNFIRKYLPQGQIFGNWEKQRLLSEKIERELLSKFY